MADPSSQERGDWLELYRMLPPETVRLGFRAGLDSTAEDQKSRYAAQKTVRWTGKTILDFLETNFKGLHSILMYIRSIIYFTSILLDTLTVLVFSIINNIIEDILI